jgi:hypothetical protein
MHTDEWQIVEDVTVTSAPVSPMQAVRPPMVLQPQPMLHQYQEHIAVIDHIAVQPEPQPQIAPVEPEPALQEVAPQPIAQPIPAPVPEPAPPQPAPQPAAPVVPPPPVINQARLMAAIAMRAGFR